MKANTALASLSQQHPTTGIAVCTLELFALSPTSPEQRVHLLPDGRFKSSLGDRPADVASGFWLMDAHAAASLQAHAAQRVNDYTIDYEHQTINKEKNGQPAPAAGWWRGFEYVPGEGLFATNVRWTERAAGYIRALEYRYTSLVFEYDLATGRPIRALHAALTNDPAVDGLQAVAALTARHTDHQPEGDHTMWEELFKRFLAKHRVSTDGVDLTNVAACTALVEQAEAKLDTLNQHVTSVAALTTQIDTLKAAKPDPSQYVPIAVANELRTSLAALTAQHQGATLDKTISDARAAGKLLASEESWARDLATRQGLAALTANLEARPAIAALTAPPQSQQHQQEPQGTAALTAEEKAVCAATGLSHEAFLAAKKGI